MGRSVSYPSNTAAVCFQNLSWIGLDENEDFDEDLAPFHWDCFLDDLKADALELNPGLYDCDEWIGREDHAILEDDHWQVGVSEYCGLAAIWLVEKDLDEDDEALDPLRKAAFIARFQQTFGELVKVGTFSNGEAVFQAA